MRNSHPLVAVDDPGSPRQPGLPADDFGAIPLVLISVHQRFRFPGMLGFAGSLPCFGSRLFLLAKTCENLAIGFVGDIEEAAAFTLVKQKEFSCSVLLFDDLVVICWFW